MTGGPATVLEQHGRPRRLPLHRRRYLEFGLALTLLLALPWHAAADPALERRACVAFKSGDYEQVLRLVGPIPESQLSRPLLRLASFSQARLGRPEAAWRLYLLVVPTGKPDEPALLREIAQHFLSRYTREPAEYLRVVAYTALAQNPAPETLPLLEDGLLDSSVLVRAQAATGLGALTTHPDLRKRIVGILTRMLSDPAPAVQIAAMEGLGGSGGREAIEQLTAIARKQEGPVEVFASAALFRLGRSDSLATIRGATTLPDPESRMAAFAVLGRLKQRATLSLLSQSVYDPDPAVRAFGAGALGEFGDPAGLAALEHAVTDESGRVRAVAAASLGRIGAASSKPLLRQATRDPDPLVRAGAVEGLLRLGESEAVLIAADLARHSEPSVRAAAAQAVGFGGLSKGVSVLERLLQDQQPQVRLAAARAAGRLGGRSGVELAKKGLQDSEPAVRIAAAESLLRQLKSGGSKARRSDEGAPC